MTALILHDDHLGAGDPSSYRLRDVVAAGRAKTEDLLSSVGSLQVNVAGSLPGPTNFVCGLPIYGPAKDAICSLPDLVVPAERDFSGDTCNAISVVLQFQAGPAELGEPDVASAAPTDTACGPNFRDTCAR
jgi:hypothetical protein